MPISRKELVDRAIRFGSPDRIPIVFWNRDQAEGDVMLYHLALGIPGDGTPNTWNWSTNEWGYRLESLGDGTMGHPVAPFYPQLPTPEDVRVPDLREAERMSAVPAFLDTCGDRYRLASFDLSGFTVYVEEYGVMGMSAENYRACGEAFRRLHKCRGRNN